MSFNLARAVVVFDLDDTLYPEADYVVSGVRFVCAKIKELYGKDLYPEINTALQFDPKIDWIALVIELAGLPIAAKESLLWMYRLHEPDIQLSLKCNQALKKIGSRAVEIAVLTDGRSVTQRLKLKALGLADLPAYISEDHGEPKPSPERFNLIQQHYSAQHYVYVADNVKKDFLGCNPLGWVCIGMRGNARNLYSQELKNHHVSAYPSCWVNSWEELTAMLFDL